MLAVAPLMIEHRLIERMIAVLNSELEVIASSGFERPAGASS
jgi:hypothetical protein